MIIIKNKASIEKMHNAGKLLSEIFEQLPNVILVGTSTLVIDSWIEKELLKNGLVSKMKGYMGYKHVSCISLNDEVVHGVPTDSKIVKQGDLVKIDVCASLKGYCADMARCFFVGESSKEIKQLVEIAKRALDAGISKAHAGNHLTDISAAIQAEIDKYGFGILKDFAGHGIGKSMHEDPEILNYGEAGKGPVLQVGMAFAIEPMITLGGDDVYITQDGWTVKTKDKSFAAHVEDTIAITNEGPIVLTRYNQEERV